MENASTGAGWRLRRHVSCGDEVSYPIATPEMARKDTLMMAHNQGVTRAAGRATLVLT
jgi:hypothetical protein